MKIVFGIILSIANAGLWVVWTAMCAPPSAFSHPARSLVSIGLFGAISAALIYAAGSENTSKGVTDAQ